MSTVININYNIITWAIKRAGYELQEFAAKFPKVLDWLEENKKPTLKQLEEFSQKVHIPFGYLFLEQPPKEKLPIPFFRTINNQEYDISLNVYDTILLIQRRQEWLVEYLEEIGSQPLKFVGKFNIKNDYKRIVADIRSTLRLDEEWANKFRTWEETLSYLTLRIEEIGIVITFNGIVENNTHRPIKVEDCRGFVLVDRIAPFMFINAADAKAAQMFTIVHELAHIWIGSSAGFDFQQMMPAKDPIEQLCDQVAAEFLVPEKSFIIGWKEKPDFMFLARRFKVSPIVIARRALDLQKISKKSFFEFYHSYIKQVQQKKDGQQGGGDFYVTQKKRLSLRFTAYVHQAIKDNQLLYRDAYKLTGLTGSTYQNFINKHF